MTTDGILEWQDTLNELNLPFFEAADAIFINYTWKQETPQQAAAVAGARRHDVYMGVDVFGRNTFGGGGMTCDVALAAARSAGLFALCPLPSPLCPLPFPSAFRPLSSAFALCPVQPYMMLPLMRQDCFCRGAFHGISVLLHDICCDLLWCCGLCWVKPAQAV